MAYAIVINLDYVNHSTATCKEIWDVIVEQFVRHGFRRDGRIFTINEDKTTATQMARDIIDGIESHQNFEDKRIFNYMKDFYGFDLGKTANLLLPPDDTIILDD